MFDFAKQILFPAPTTKYTSFGFPSELLWFPLTGTDYSLTEPSEYCPAILLQSKCARFMFIYFHSNGEDIGTTYRFTHRLRSLTGANVLSVELPGYGICPGTPSEESCAKVAKAAMSFVLNILHWPVEDVISMGRSMGTYLALQAAVDLPKKLAGVVLISPFASIRSTVIAHIGFLGGLIPNIFDNRALASRLKSRLVVIHGSEDGMVPLSEGQKVLAHALNPHKKIYVPPIDHCADLFSTPDSLDDALFDSFPLPNYQFDHTLCVPSAAFDRRHAGIVQSKLSSWAPLARPVGDSPARSDPSSPMSPVQPQPAARETRRRDGVTRAPRRHRTRSMAMRRRDDAVAYGGTCGKCTGRKRKRRLTSGTSGSCFTADDLDDREEFMEIEIYGF
eukprot:GEMP01009447.1.p1 GENE.GEMP01009447.1~~GEMP01009447.1.p1  ORF type:complete len:391 (+),score=54.13 GEMP01009447.1:68-1240(+)